MADARGVVRIALLCAAAAAPAAAQIHDIRAFLNTCPQNDPAYARIRADFTLRRNGQIVDVPPCTEPLSAMPTSAYTDELLIVQGLRVIYYMDRGMSGHLPWTAGTLYDWMKSKIGGIEIVQGGSFCCLYYGPAPPLPPPNPNPTPPPPQPAPPLDPKFLFIAVGAEDDFNREFDKKWIGIAGNIDLYAHETRHTDDFPHSSCCGIPGGCDDKFDPASLSPYAVQWWLNKLWLDGTIDVGVSCFATAERAEAANWFRSALDGFAARFCTDRPPAVAVPALPGGACRNGERHRAAGRR